LLPTNFAGDKFRAGNIWWDFLKWPGKIWWDFFLKMAGNIWWDFFCRGKLKNTRQFGHFWYDFPLFGAAGAENFWTTNFAAEKFGGIS
jgi:hypothetical protein